jgi:hypothetical protein
MSAESHQVTGNNNGYKQYHNRKVGDAGDIANPPNTDTPQQK